MVKEVSSGCRTPEKRKIASQDITNTHRRKKHIKKTSGSTTSKYDFGKLAKKMDFMGSEFTIFSPSEFGQTSDFTKTAHFCVAKKLEFFR